VGELKPFNIDSLHSRLAKWYIGAAPRELLTNFKLKSTNIPLDFFKEPLNTPLADAFPNCWKFWNASVEKPNPLSAPYHGGFEDSYSIRGTPYRNVVLHEPLLAMIGTLPALFELFLHGQGHTPGKQTKIVLNQIKRRLYKHLRKRWTTYQRLVHTARRQAEADAATLAAAAATPLTTPSFTGGPCRIGKLQLNILILLCSTTPALLWQPDGPLGLSSGFFIRASEVQGFYLRICSFGVFGATSWPVPFAFFRPRTLNDMSPP
jgi:hypothetical protein